MPGRARISAAALFVVTAKPGGRQPSASATGHAMGEHTGLPRAGAGEHEHVPTGRGDRRPLRIV